MIHVDEYLMMFSFQKTTCNAECFRILILTFNRDNSSQVSTATAVSIFRGFSFVDCNLTLHFFELLDLFILSLDCHPNQLLMFERISLFKNKMCPLVKIFCDIKYRQDKEATDFS